MMLKVYAVEARNLPALDMNGSSDPYLVVYFQDQKAKTRTLKNNLNPVWNELFNFTVVPGDRHINIAIYDEDVVGSDELEGVCVLELPNEAECDQKMVIEWKSLEDSHQRDTGAKLRVGYQYIYDLARLIDSTISQREEELKESEDRRIWITDYLKHTQSK